MIVSVDAQGLEWRMAVYLSQDKVGMAELLNNEDIHSKNQKTFNLPSRLISKIYLFRTIFRGSGYAFSKDPDFSHVSTEPEYWENLNKKFYNKYYGLDAWHKSLANLSAQRLPIVGPTGRTWIIPPYKKEIVLPNGATQTVEKLNWPKFTNSPVQGTGADFVLLARLRLFKLLKELNLPAKIINTVHDSITLDVPKQYVNEAVTCCKQAFDSIPEQMEKYFKVKVNVPFPGECKVGTNFANLEKI